MCSLKQQYRWLCQQCGSSGEGQKEEYGLNTLCLRLAAIVVLPYRALVSARHAASGKHVLDQSPKFNDNPTHR